MFDPRLQKPWWALRLSYGLVPIVAGLDKFTNLLTDWTQYMSPLVPLPPRIFMPIVGVIEIAAGVLVLSRLTRVGAYVVSAWLIGIALNLLTTGRYFDIAARDVVLAVGAFALARLTELRESARAQGVTSFAASKAAPTTTTSSPKAALTT
jgi:uncharacterized membrane protein YphA (DoxX/SURF4 family)